jgi:hypothetical protein
LGRRRRRGLRQRGGCDEKGQEKRAHSSRGFKRMVPALTLPDPKGLARARTRRL